MDVYADDNSIAEPLVVISIVGFRNAGDVEDCLTAVTNLTYRNYIVSICENGGSDAFQLLVARLHGLVSPDTMKNGARDVRVERIWSGTLKSGGQRVHVLQAMTNLGFAGGVNVTLTQLADNPEWDAIWLLNPDAQPDPGALSALSQRARETGAFIVGGRLVHSDTGRIQLYGGRWRKLIARGYNIGLGSPKDAPVDTSKIENEMNYVNGAAMFVRRAFVDKFGLMDEEYFLYCEEIDWCLRMEKKYLRYAHDCIVYHRHGTTIGSNADPKRRSDLSIYLSERNKLLLSRRYFSRIYPIIVITTLLMLLQFVAKGASERLGIGFRGWLAGLRGERGAPIFLLESRKDA